MYQPFRESQIMNTQNKTRWNYILYIHLLCTNVGLQEKHQILLDFHRKLLFALSFKGNCLYRFLWGIYYLGLCFFFIFNGTQTKKREIKRKQTQQRTVQRIQTVLSLRLFQIHRSIWNHSVMSIFRSVENLVYVTKEPIMFSNWYK